MAVHIGDVDLTHCTEQIKQGPHVSTFERTIAAVLSARPHEPRRPIQAIVGPRQVGKTTAVLQVRARLEAEGVPFHYGNGDEPLLPSAVWIDEQWHVARASSAAGEPAALCLDEVHRIPLWADRVKANWELDSIIEPSVARDVLSMGRIDRPALLRQLFCLACDYSGRVISYTKLVGQLQDAGGAGTRWTTLSSLHRG